MSEASTIEELNTAMSRSPFQPFLILLADGRVIPVPYRAAIACGGPWGPYLRCVTEGRRLARIDIDQVVSLRFPALEREPSPLIGRIRSAMRAQPYRLFRIILEDGTLHTIGQAEHIAISPGDRRQTISFYTRDDRKPGGYDHHYVKEDQILDVIAPEESRPSAPESAVDNSA